MADHVEIKIDIVAKEPIEQAETLEENHQNDVEHGHADPEEELTLMHYAETIEIIDNGCPVKCKVGVAGDVPEKDSFPFFKSTKKFLCLLWGGDAQEWRLLTFDGDRPEDIYDPEQNFKANYVMLRDVTSVFLENEPSCSFRVYSGENVVTRYTPQPEARDHADAWVNAIFAAMELQTAENDPQDLAELRQKYLDSFEPIADGDENGAALVASNHADEGHVDLEAGGAAGGSGVKDRRRDSSSTQKSAFDFTHIYGGQGANGEQPKSCCTIS